MACKFLVATIRPWMILQRIKNVPQKIFTFPQTMTAKSVRGLLLPPTQYDMTVPERLKLTPSILFKHYEKLPLVVLMVAGLSTSVFNILWAIFNKVDVVFRTHSRKNISRTMDLLMPTVHKLVIIEQQYDPWPQMYKVLNKMKLEHCRRRRMEKKKRKTAATVC